MPGFITNAKSIHAGQKETGFVRAGLKKRHRWDLKQLPTKPGTPKPKSPKLHALEASPLGQTDDFGGLQDSEGPGDMMDAFEDPNAVAPIKVKPKPKAIMKPKPVAPIQLDPAAHAAFMAMMAHGGRR